MKKKEEVQEEIVIDAVKISTISANFGREDLNALVDKLNEVIEYINEHK